MGKILFTFRKLWQNVRAERASVAVNVAVLTLTFLTVVLVCVVASNVLRISGSIEDQYQVTVYLRDGIDPGRFEEVASGLGLVEGVQSVERIGPEEFRSRFLDAAGGGAAAEVPLEVFPSVLQVQLVPDWQSRMNLSGVVGKIRLIDAVETVETHEGWMKQLKGLASVLGLAALGFGACIMLCTVLIVANTMKLSFIRRKRVVEVMRLFGATNGIIEAPVLLEGFLQGLAGALVAVAAGWGFVALIDSRVGTLSSGALPWHLGFMPSAWTVAFVCACGIVGLVGAHLATIRALRT